jgi:hypothetical protein
VVLSADDQQSRRRDQVVFVANRLLVDHLEAERGSTPRSYRGRPHAQGGNEPIRHAEAPQRR